MATIEEAAKLWKRRSLAIEANTARILKNVAKRVLTDLVEQTPIDTGLAKSNWFAALDRKPFAYKFTPYAPGEKGSTTTQNVAAATAAGVAVIDKFDGKKNKAIWLANYLPYIGRLNEGYSPQASAGYVQKIVRRSVRGRAANILKGDF